MAAAEIAEPRRKIRLTLFHSSALDPCKTRQALSGYVLVKLNRRRSSVKENSNHETARISDGWRHRDTDHFN